ncbi:MAG: hypothetical protein COV66_03540 [Nitrospinae bacterium CG11_big_fil_rev_8_21_14_0_20_45_15]|nr:MAG: hypothetical protein COV66_03540 [Nitrospinae bacterium CG11_big_fil_rev_8_21_14_0_20_45_15]
MILFTVNRSETYTSSESTATTCLYCGQARLNANPLKPIQCKHCGKSIGRSDRICSGCGAQVPGALASLIAISISMLALGYWIYFIFSTPSSP